MMKTGQAVKLRAYDDVIKDKECARFVDNEDIYGISRKLWERIRAADINTFVDNTTVIGIVEIKSSYGGIWFVPEKALNKVGAT